MASPLAAQSAHANFAGKWTLDVSASTAGPMTPTSMNVVVTQDDKTINAETDATTPAGDQKSTQVVNLDGSPSKNTISGGGESIDLTTTSVWDGATLVVTTRATVQGQDLQQVDRWVLEPDGKTLDMARSLSIAGQNLDVKLVFRKG
ncbi:MAG TPA: hypothetical protein VGM67_08660 [Gemmatimonadaceae bacterium]